MKSQDLGLGPARAERDAIAVDALHSETGYRSFFENLQELVNVFEPLCDEDGKPVDWIIRDANRASRESLGVERESLLGRRASEVMGEGIGSYLEVFRRVHETGEPWSGEVTLAGRDYFSRVFRLQEDRLASTRIEVTDRNRAVAALRDNEARYRGLFDNMADEVHLWDLVRDARGEVLTCRLIDANASALSSWSRSLEAVRGRTVPEIFGDEVAARYLPPVRDAVGRRRSVAFDEFLPLLGRHMRVTVVPLGEQVLTTSSDITSIKSAQELSERRRAELEAVYDAMADGVKVFDLSGRVILANEAAARLFGYGSPEELKRDLAYFASTYEFQTLEGTPIPLSDWPVSRVLRGESVEDVELRVRRLDTGREWLLQCSGEPVRVNQGQQRLAVVVTRDVSERSQAQAALRQANDRLREADRRKDEFLAMLSHELRNPLAPIRNSVYVLEHADPASDRARRAREVIDRQTRHLARLVDDLLDVTRVSRGKVKLQRERVDLAEVVRRTVEDHRETFTAAGVALEAEISGPAVVDGDPTRLAQVLENLLGNAAKFTPRGGRTLVSLQPEPAGMATLRVQDDGAGIAAETLPLLFEPFVQAEKTLDRSRGGLGLGLALVKGLVEMHGGSVAAASDGSGRGACFTVRLPIVQQAEAPNGASREDRLPRARRVLVIEDNLDAAESLREALELAGHEVELAHDGPGGVAAALVFEPEVVLCDIGLPGMTGFEVARALRGEPRLRATHLVALSGYALQDDIERAREAGFADHVAKPPDLAALDELFARLSREY